MIIGVDTPCRWLPDRPWRPQTAPVPFAFQPATGLSSVPRASGQTVAVPMMMLNNDHGRFALDYMATILEKAVEDGEDFERGPSRSC